MLKNRLIPVVLLKNGVVVQSKMFRRYQSLGNPVTIVERIGDWGSDELIYIDISRGEGYDLNRSDLNFDNHGTVLDILADVARHCIVPLTFGGGIRTVEDVRLRLAGGADKVTLNRQALDTPDIITDCAREFGAQAIVVSIDAKATEDGGWEVCTDGNRIATGRTPADWAREAQERGAGEILINSIDRDGAGRGYDLDLIAHVADAVSVPVIALGGAREWEHFGAGLDAGADAVAAANIFSHMENSVYKAKQYLYVNDYNVRTPSFIPQAGE